jgi:hypothetical protein
MSAGQIFPSRRVRRKAVKPPLKTRYSEQTGAAQVGNASAIRYRNCPVIPYDALVRNGWLMIIALLPARINTDLRKMPRGLR